MAYSLGGYSSQLQLDDYNNALANSGSQYRLPEQQQAAPAQAQAQAQPPAGSVAPPSVDNVQPVQTTAGEKAGLVGGLLGGNGGGNKLGAVLKIVGSLYGGGAGQAVSAAGSAADAKKNDDKAGMASSVGGLLGKR